MSAFSDLVSQLFDIVIGLCDGSAVLAMILVSALTSVWVLLLFKAVTPQAKLTRTRDLLFGHIYEMGMYQDHLGVVGRIQRDLAKANIRYLSLTLPALLALTVPMVITLAQLDSRFAHRPLEAGEATVFSVELEKGVSLEGVDLVVPAGVLVEAGPVRDTGRGRVAWRLRAEAEGEHTILVLRGGTELGSRDLMVGDGLPRLSETNKTGWLNAWLAPGAESLTGEIGLAAMTLRYPSRRTRYLGIELDWLVAFMVLSLVAGLVFKDPLKVSI
jgi:hypothetical protein